MTHRHESGSTKEHGSVIVNSVFAFDQWTPPSVDLNMTCLPCVGRPLRDGFSNCSANTYTFPSLSDRTVHPDDPNPPWPCPPASAGWICFLLQVSPPSRETNTVSGAIAVPGLC